MSPDQRRHGRKLAQIVEKYRMTWAIATLVLYLVAVPATIAVFPDNSLWLALLVLFSGATATLATIADLLVSSEAVDEARDGPPPD
jgi:hypothetical protein